MADYWKQDGLILTLGNDFSGVPRGTTFQEVPSWNGRESSFTLCTPANLGIGVRWYSLELTGNVLTVRCCAKKDMRVSAKEQTAGKARALEIMEVLPPDLLTRRFSSTREEIADRIETADSVFLG